MNAIYLSLSTRWLLRSGGGKPGQAEIGGADPRIGRQLARKPVKTATRFYAP